MDTQFSLNDTSTREKIKRICNGILTEIAPEEMILVDQVFDICVENPSEAMSDREFSNHTDKPLGFGGNDDLYTAIIVPIIISVLSKMITSFSDENLKQAVNTIKNGKGKKGLEVETKIDEIKKEITIRLSGKSLTRKKAVTITNRILRLIAEELSN